MKTKFFLILICLFTLTSSVFAQTETAGKFEEFGDTNCEEYLARMDNVIFAAANNPSSKIYVFVYEGKLKKYEYKKDGSYTVKSVFPQYGLANAKIRSMKKKISPLRSSSAEGFVFVKAGFRENFTVEFWLVPAGAAPPQATPNLTKMRYGKGKPYGFCLGCCE